MKEISGLQAKINTPGGEQINLLKIQLGLVNQSVSKKHRLISIIGLVLRINGLFWELLIGITQIFLDRNYTVQQV